MNAFIRQADVDVEQVGWGTVAWHCRHANTGSAQLVVMEVTLGPGQAHDFHRHPRQEEFITVRSGTVLQYLDRESARLAAGDSVHVGMGTVHATFNTGDGPAQILVIIGPAIGPDSYEVVDVSHEQPWASIERPARPGS
jgi:quercetin dioxygenase-like cupin family protein